MHFYVSGYVDKGTGVFLLGTKNCSGKRISFVRFVPSAGFGIGVYVRQNEGYVLSRNNVYVSDVDIL